MNYFEDWVARKLDHEIISTRTETAESINAGVDCLLAQIKSDLAAKDAQIVELRAVITLLEAEIAGLRKELEELKDV